MRPSLMRSLFFTALVLAAAARASAGDYVKRVVLDDERVLMVEITIPPGAESPQHSHRWGRAIYVIAGGTLELLPAAGGGRTLDLEAGLGVWREPEDHRVRNAGDTTIRLLEVEVKTSAEPAQPERRRR